MVAKCANLNLELLFAASEIVRIKVMLERLVSDAEFKKDAP
jgi:hypothetical protein